MLETLRVLASAGRRSVNFPLTSVKTPWEGNSTQVTDAATTGSLSSAAMTTPVTVTCFF